ncbi:MAG: TIR domain-containing protein [Saprospiraceae bacterium]|nr:TIR domain-containing protein [Saprospiraceae bacterium]
MTKPTFIAELESVLGFSLNDLTGQEPLWKVIEHLAFLDACMDDRESATAADLERVALERLKMSVCRNCYFCAADGTVIGLNLFENGLAQLPIPGNSGWRELRVLHLAENKLAELTLPADWKALEYIDLGDNKTLRALRIEGAVPALERLDASDSALEHLVVPAGMAALKHLDVSRNKLQSVVFEGDCPTLEWLDLSRNALSEFELPGGFLKLKHLYLPENKNLKYLHFSNPLFGLETLHLRNCALESLPAFLPDFSSLNTLYLHGNPLPAMQDIIPGGESANAWKAVHSYLSAQQRAHLMLPLREAKLILVGNGEVGKTSISIKLRNPDAPLPDKKDRTPGLAIEPYRLENLLKSETGQDQVIPEFQLNIWDFGGQGQYREIQQIFCSRKSLYLFVTACDDRPEKEDYVGFQYWLSMVSGFSFDENTSHSPVIFVVNKIDLEEKSVDEKTIKKAFPNIKTVVKISCETLKRFGTLVEEIRSHLKSVSPDVFSALYPKNWLDVKATLESQKSNNIISKSEYLQICNDHQIVYPDEAITWLDTLDRIGVVIHMGSHPQLADKIILNPEWVKDAIVQVIDSQEDRDGIIREQDFPKIWHNYPARYHEDLIQLLVAYQLCFKQIDERGRPEYVMPSLLPDASPQLPAYLTGAPVSRFRLVFQPFIPAGTVNKLTVQIKNDRFFSNPEKGNEAGSDALIKNRPLINIEVLDRFFWNKNVILLAPMIQSYAHVRECWEDHAIEIDFYQSESRDFLEMIEFAVRQLNTELKVSRKVFHLDFDVEVFRFDKWKNLKNLEEEGVGVFEQERVPRNKTASKLKCFVSYAHADDSRYMRCFIEGIKAHSNWEIFDDRGIGLGAKWDETLQEEVEKCDFGIYLLSQRFIKSEYIREKEFGAFVERQNKSGFPFFGILLSACNFKPFKDIADRQFFIAYGQDYGLADTHRDKQITFDRLARINDRGEILPNPDLEEFFMNFVAAANAVLKEKYP